MAVNNKLKEEATLFFKEYKRAKGEFLKLSHLREEKAGIIELISYIVLFLGVMLIVGVRLYGITSLPFYIVTGAITAAALIYLVINQIRIAVYEKQSRKKRDAEFEKVKSSYNKMTEKFEYFKALKECRFDEKVYEAKLEAEKKEKERERILRQEEIAKNRKFDDSVCVHCHEGICNFDGDETIYSFRCDYTSCRWRTKKK